MQGFVLPIIGNLHLIPVQVEYFWNSPTNSYVWRQILKKISLITGIIVALGFGMPAAAQDSGELLIVNESSVTMCAVYIATPDEDFADSLELLSSNELGCIYPGTSATILYDEDLSDCYAVVDIFDEVADPVYGNGFELCTRTQIIITDDDLSQADNDGENEPFPEVVEGGDGYQGYLEITNQSSQQICQVYFESLEGDRVEVYQPGDNGDCLNPGMTHTLEYDTMMSTCEVRLSVETGFLDTLYDTVYDLCQGDQLVVSN